MSVTTPSVSAGGEQSVAVSTDVIWRFSVDQYHAMIRTGILTEDDPVELLEGGWSPRCPRTPTIYRQQQNYGPIDTVPMMIEGREVGRLVVRDLLP